MRPEYFLSVVIIARNEEKHIAACIDSCRRMLDLAGTSEVLVVDSASSDRTAEIALSSGAVLVQLNEGHVLTPASGRYAGSLVAKGEYVLFVDGDMTVEPAWVSQAVRCIGHAGPQVVGATGVIDERYCVDSRLAGGRQNIYGITARELVTSQLAGIMLFRRAELLEAGSFNPRMLGDEEMELWGRLRLRGYEVLRIPSRAAIHFTEPTVTLSEVLRRLRAGMPLGLGQTLRNSMRNGSIRVQVKRLTKYLVAALWGMAGFLGLCLGMLGLCGLWGLLWASGTVVGLLILTIRHEMRLRDAIIDACYASSASLGLLLGFFFLRGAQGVVPSRENIRVVRGNDSPSEGGSL